MTYVHHCPRDLAHSVQRQYWLITQEEACHVELLKCELSQLLSISLNIIREHVYHAAPCLKHKDGTGLLRTHTLEVNNGSGMMTLPSSSTCHPSCICTQGHQQMSTLFVQKQHMM